ncbi:MAG: glutaredoxin family protein [Dehalococcoidia bacterium]|jgi:glutaredoxin|nr:glutaredoxin family protein [Dehalococcoidia bacterium]MDP6510289.1 glutaredoxin family protein [Dehalococcoidia bacterium]MDP6782482.1 glutaredoxin family protein [Dehalococcoidia bacterium]
MAAEAHSVLFYTKAGCHLCHDARWMLQGLGSRYPLIVTEVDIASDEALRQRYGEAIPVIVVDGRFTLAGRIDEADLDEWLAEHPPVSTPPPGP